MSIRVSAEPGPTGHARLTLDLDLAADPVAGVLSGAGSDEPFVGWSGLTRAIELALETARAAAAGALREGGR